MRMVWDGDILCGFRMGMYFVVLGWWWRHTLQVWNGDGDVLYGFRVVMGTYFAGLGWGWRHTLWV